MNSFTNLLTPSQAYCADLMGVTRWAESGSQLAPPLAIHRTSTPWPVKGQLSPSFVQPVGSEPAGAMSKSTMSRGDVSRGEVSKDEMSKNTALERIVPALTPAILQEDTRSAAFSSGFTTEAVEKKTLEKTGDVVQQDKSVASLREELSAAPEIIIEDLQPIEELAVAIDVPQVVNENLPKQIHCLSFFADNRLLILSDMPPSFQDGEAVEKLALKMSQALLKKSINEWQTNTFNWPVALRNPYFRDRTDWMLGAFESFIESQILSIKQDADTNENSPLLLVLAGQHMQKLVPELKESQVLQQAKTVEIVSLPELYRIPEYKVEAWQRLQQLQQLIA